MLTGSITKFLSLGFIICEILDNSLLESNHVLYSDLLMIKGIRLCISLICLLGLVVIIATDSIIFLFGSSYAENIPPKAIGL